jgi:hypothetical protein
VFLTMMVIGIVGLVMMALPALGGHHLPPGGHGHGVGVEHGLGAGSSAHSAGALAAGHSAPTSVGGLSHPVAGSVSVSASSARLHPTTLPVAPSNRRFIPSPRDVFSVLALYGAFGNALVHAAHLRSASAAFIAIGPALLVEWLLIRPVWNLMFRFQGEASSPLGELIYAEAQAVVPFRNGRGLVTTVRDGRRVQLHAQLCAEQATAPVLFGQRLRIEDVDARRERVTVSLLSNESPVRNPA